APRPDVGVVSAAGWAVTWRLLMVERTGFPARVVRAADRAVVGAPRPGADAPMEFANSESPERESSGRERVCLHVLLVRPIERSPELTTAVATLKAVDRCDSCGAQAYI